MNEETLEWLELERRKQNGTLDKWNIAIYTEGFFVKISGGEETKSDPPRYLEHISQYTAVIVELYDRREHLSKETIDKFNEPFEVAGYTIKFNTVVFPHIAISPMQDKRFKDQPWAFPFNHSSLTFAPSARLTLDEFEQVMKYLIRLDNLAAFL